MAGGQQFVNSILRRGIAERSVMKLIPGSPRIGFQPVSGKTYRLDYRDALNLGNWVTLVNGIFAPNNSVIQIIDPSGAGLNRRLYRVDLEP